jgi:hypothetical protein
MMREVLRYLLLVALLLVTLLVSLSGMVCDRGPSAPDNKPKQDAPAKDKDKGPEQPKAQPPAK